MDSPSTRALLELSSSSPKRNSPSHPGNKNFLNSDSSPFQSSPLSVSVDNMASPRLFWQGRDNFSTRLNTENFFGNTQFVPSAKRRTSIEKLQRASPVKNSSMFAREQKLKYDHNSHPVIERPFKKVLQGNAYGGSGLSGYRLNQQRSDSPKYQKRDSIDSKASIQSNSRYGYDSNTTRTINNMGNNMSKSNSRDQLPPTKSSLSHVRSKSYSKIEVGTFSDDMSAEKMELPQGKTLKRHPKSVTFDAAPPQVNEYEMATPDLSSIGTGSRDNSYDSADEENDNFCQSDSLEFDNSFDASLEDIEKTPVVGPGDWQDDSSDHINSFMTGEIDDPFDEPTNRSTPEEKSSDFMSWAIKNSTIPNSNVEQRPLPPIPGVFNTDESTNISLTGDSIKNEIVQNTTDYGNSSPRATSITTENMNGFTKDEMTLTEKLNMMMIQGEEAVLNDAVLSDAETQRERRMRRAGREGRSSQTPEPKQSPGILEEENLTDDLSSPETYQLNHRISRESILRKVNGKLPRSADSDYIFSSPSLDSILDHGTFLDPDIPIPSTEFEVYDDDDDNDKEDNFMGDEDTERNSIKQEHDDDDDVKINFRDIPEVPLDMTYEKDQDEKSSFITPESESQYSEHTQDEELLPSGHQVSKKDVYSPTSPRTSSSPRTVVGEQVETYPKQYPTDFISSGFQIDSFRLSLQTSPPSDKEFETKKPSTSETSILTDNPEPSKDDDLQLDFASEQNESEIGTPESVIHHQIWPPSPCESPSIPEEDATIKSASGSSKLKTRPSGTTTDFETMRENRKIFGNDNPVIPPIPDRHRGRPMSVDRGLAQQSLRHPSFTRSLTLDFENDVSLNLENDFERVLQAQKRGYLTRQNTKIVVATSDTHLNERFYNSHHNTDSQVKHNRTKSWIVEPWAGQGQLRNAFDQSESRDQQFSVTLSKKKDQKRTTSGTSRVSDFSAPEEGAERGRLFVKVLGVKDLDLPLPSHEKTWFNLTLDNGVHCVTTAWLELGKNAPIGQEFELVVPDDLEFQLTLNAKLIKPPTPKKIVDSSSKGFKTHKTSTFSRVFTSPKKRKELEARQREEEQRYARQKEMELANRASSRPSTWDLLSPFASEDGSFGRSYICLKDHESRCFGRPYVVDVTCFNEWATESVNHPTSVMSKRATNQVQRRAPYKVAKLELQLLFVPKPKGANDDDMPKSMNSCIREMKEAEKVLATQWEGYLSQQGGDCPYWRRRYFKLAGSKLTAYHESSRQPRMTINLANARKLIDDRGTLTQKETTGKGGKRRKSAFAEEEEGYMFVEKGFRIRFNNGEVIDFYADNPEAKEAWMNALDGSIGRETDSTKKSWTSIVLRREESSRRRAEKDTEAIARKLSTNNQRMMSSISGR